MKTPRLVPANTWKGGFLPFEVSEKTVAVAGILATWVKVVPPSVLLHIPSPMVPTRTSVLLKEEPARSTMNFAGFGQYGRGKGRAQIGRDEHSASDAREDHIGCQAGFEIQRGYRTRWKSAGGRPAESRCRRC